MTSILRYAILAASMMLISASENDDGFKQKLVEDTTEDYSGLRGDGEPSSPGGNERSIIILSYALVIVILIVLTNFFWTLRKQIKEVITKCWTTTRADRPSNSQGTSSLNDIIFDPEEEQQASLSEALLPSSE